MVSVPTKPKGPPKPPIEHPKVGHYYHHVAAGLFYIVGVGRCWDRHEDVVICQKILGEEYSTHLLRSFHEWFKYHRPGPGQ